MTGEEGKLYRLLLLACLAGYGWIFVAQRSVVFTPGSDPEVCLIKHVTDIPCPSCGSTRAVLSIMDGSLMDALWWNPLGFVVAVFLALCPGWIFYDTMRRKSSLFHCYRHAERFLRRRAVAITLVSVVLGNWIWNVVKGL